MMMHDGVDMPDTFLGSHTFNVSDLTPFSVGLQNSWSNSLQLGEYDGDQAQENMEKASTLRTWRSCLLRSPSSG